MSENGGEFANGKSLDMSKSMNIKFISTAAESPFSNGLVEQHNLTLSEMLNKTLEDTNRDFDLTFS